MSEHDAENGWMPCAKNECPYRAAAVYPAADGCGGFMDTKEGAEHEQ